MPRFSPLRIKINASIKASTGIALLIFFRNVKTDELVSLSYKEAKKSFVIAGLGKLLVVDRKKRMGRNPATGETMVIPAKKSLKFRIAKQAKDAVVPSKKK